MRGLKWAVVFRLLLGLSLCGALALLALRCAAELRDRSVSSAVYYADVTALAGGDAAAWLETVGADYLICTDADEAEARALAARCGLGLGRAGETAKPGDAFLLPLTGTESVPVDAIGGDGSVPLALVEDLSRTGLLLPGGFDLEARDGPVVKALYLYPAYAAHYEDGAAHLETENILFRAALERSARLLILRPLTDAEGAAVTDPAVYRTMLENLAGRLAARGLRLGGAFSCMEAPRQNRWWLAWTAVAAALLLWELLRRLIPALDRAELRLPPLLLAAAAFGGTALLPDLAQKLLPPAAAALAGCFAGLWLERLRQRADGGNAYLRFLAGLAGLVGIGLAGGLYVAALLSARRYLLGGAVFFGVKAAQLLPLIFTAALLFFRLFPRGRLRREDLSAPRLAACALLVVAALAVLLLRSGDNAALVSGAETKVRTWLELNLYARPRTKEFLLAFPALALCLEAARREAKLPALALGVLAELGAVSVINTFCHGFAPLYVSLLRTALSALMGLALGLALLFLVRRLPARPADGRKKT